VTAPGDGVSGFLRSLAVNIGNGNLGPLACERIAVARPGPDAAPVISAILSSTRPIMFLFCPLLVPLADLQVFRSALDRVKPAAISRSLNFCILPLAVRGISSMISSRSGRYGVAVPASLRKQTMSVNVK